MIKIKEYFDQLSRSIPDRQYLINTNGVINIYYGVSDSNRLRLSFLTSRTTGTLDSTKNINVISGNNDGNYWTCFDLVNDDILSVFCTFCDDLIASVEDEMDEYKAISLLRNRYNTWKALFKKSKNPLSPERAKGLFGELYFLRKYMIEKYGINRSIESWSGPDNYSKDFAIDDKWYEIKTIGVGSVSVKISSIQQLASDNIGKLVVLRVEEMADTYVGENATINLLINNILEIVDDEIIKTNFLEKLSKLGYDICDDLGNKKYNVHSVTNYIIDEKFPVLREGDIKSQAINNVSYELIIKLIEKYKEK